MVASAVIGGVVNYNASKKGAAAQTAAANQANETERYIYDQTREDQMPWQDAGKAGINALMGLYGFEMAPVPGTGSPAVPATQGVGTGNALFDLIKPPKKTPAKEAVQPEMQWRMASDPSAVSKQFMVQDPGYQFRLDEGQRAIENGAAARGGMLSGNFLKAAQKYGQDYASNEFSNIANRYGQLSGIGQTTNSQLQKAGSEYAEGYGSNIMASGAARASGYAGQANAITGAINGPKNDALYLAGLAFGRR